MIRALAQKVTVLIGRRKRQLSPDTAAAEAVIDAMCRRGWSFSCMRSGGMWIAQFRNSGLVFQARHPESAPAIWAAAALASGWVPDEVSTARQEAVWCADL